jgi:hypothetical protein
MSIRPDVFKIFSLGFPEQYNPITGLCVVVGDELPPPGYHKVFVNLHQRLESVKEKDEKEQKAEPKQEAWPHVYLCQTRGTPIALHSSPSALGSSCTLDSCRILVSQR